MGTHVHEEGDMVTIADGVAGKGPFASRMAVHSPDDDWSGWVNNPSDGLFVEYIERRSSEEMQRCIVWVNALQRRVIIRSQFIFAAQ